jgi:hypothetical protein
MADYIRFRQRMMRIALITTAGTIPLIGHPAMSIVFRCTEMRHRAGAYAANAAG